jgi:dihydroorotase
MKGKLLLKGGRVVDPSRAFDRSADVLIVDGQIAAVGLRLSATGAHTVDVSGLVVCPGFIDLHAHLREPGREDKETLATGGRAAAAGGYAAVCAMADTDPPNDTAGITRAIREIAARDSIVRIYPVGAITKGRAGAELAEYGDLKDAGCVAFSDDGRPVESARVMRRALEYAKTFDLTLIDHCEEPSLTEGTVMNEGPVATHLGLRGVPPVAEAILVERDVLLAEMTGGKVHIAHVTTAAGVDAVRRGKARGVRVTAEATPAHLLLTDGAVREMEYDTSTRISPPLRSEADRSALLDGLRDGTIDAIVTDHSPHAVDDKKVEFDQAASGISSLETAVALCLDRLVGPGLLGLAQLVSLLSYRPAKILGLPGGTLAVGAPGDVTVLSLARRRQVDPRLFESKGRSTPFAGWTLKGWPAMTIVGGRVVWKDAKSQ